MKTKTITTVWTNHGEPQPLDDEHFGVALQAESEADATRQADELTWHNDMKAHAQRLADALKIGLSRTLEHFRQDHPSVIEMRETLAQWEASKQ